MHIDRVVETFEWHPPVVHYRCPPPDDLNGERLRAELIAAGVPDFDTPIDLPAELVESIEASGATVGDAIPRTMVTLYRDPGGDFLDIAIPYDVDTDHTDLIDRITSAHLGSQHPDELELRDFADRIDAVRQRVLAGDDVPLADLAFFVAVVTS